MSVQILSDLHLEVARNYDTFEVIPKAPYLALVGDIGAVNDDGFFSFLKRQLAQFRAVLLVTGNHEAYHSTWTETLRILCEFQETVRSDASLGDFVVLDRAMYRLADSKSVVLGCSFFSHVPTQSHDEVGRKLNDFRYTTDWTVTQHNEAHARDLAWLNSTVASLGEDTEIIILTHWSPSTHTRAVDPRHAKSSIRSAFATDMSRESCFKSPKTKVWVFGHTHYNCDFVVKRRGASPLRIVTNQAGYFSGADGFDSEKTIDTANYLKAVEDKGFSSRDCVVL
ncbi:calcineurin-like phosphoesterase domain-containing protein [Sarocladium implicatum]|nr:calcineurin-like phosphoesterase domain-containing protein [Sarocladium implicatum]